MRPALLLLFIVAFRPAGAQEPASPKKADASAPAPAKKQVKAIRLEAVQIDGRIPKPEAFYFLDRSKPSFDDLNRAESFVPEVVQSVQQDPF